MALEKKMLFAIVGIVVAVAVVSASYFILFADDDGPGGNNPGGGGNGPTIYDPNVALTLEANQTSYAFGDTIQLSYSIKNNEATNLSIAEYQVSVKLVLGSSKVQQLYMLTTTLKPGEIDSGTINVTQDLDVGEHMFYIDVMEITGVNQYLLTQRLQIIVNVV